MIEYNGNFLKFDNDNDEKIDGNVVVVVANDDDDDDK